MTNMLFDFLSDKYASGEASLDNCEAYLSFCESNDTSPRAHFYGVGQSPFDPCLIFDPQREKCLTLILTAS
jgi:hypothetical protein